MTWAIEYSKVSKDGNTDRRLSEFFPSFKKAGKEVKRYIKSHPASAFQQAASNTWVSNDGEKLKILRFTKQPLTGKSVQASPTSDILKYLM
jgi:hypothetical protein